MVFHIMRTAGQGWVRQCCCTTPGRGVVHAKWYVSYARLISWENVHRGNKLSETIDV